MRIVPPSRLLIQPTVQLKWLEQHRTIEFELSEMDQDRYYSVWQNYRNSKFKRLADFLNSEQAQQDQLFDDDIVFALLTGADYMTNKQIGFRQEFKRPNLIWHIEPIS